jgi:Arc/MetJ family transcription regulator
MTRRTNIELDARHVRTIMRRYGLQTQGEAVAMALRVLASQPFDKEEALGVKGSQEVDDLPLDRGPIGRR